ARAALRGVRTERPLPVVPRLARRQGDEQPAVLVVRGEEVGRHRLRDPRAGPELVRLVELAADPLAGAPGRVPAAGGSLQPERVHDVPADQLRLLVARQLEDAAARGEHPRVAIADDEAGARRGVVVVEELEQEPEAAPLAGRRLVEQALAAVVV